VCDLNLEVFVAQSHCEQVSDALVVVDHEHTQARATVGGGAFFICPRLHRLPPDQKKLKAT
jgi:hypothetical protein